MADIFISYSKKDRLLAGQLGGLLQEVGFTVWWDTELLPATEFRQEIRRQIQAAQAVIVIWSENSAKSAFVIDEADLARETGKLISTLADGFAINGVPLGFRNTHLTSLSDGDALIRALSSRGLAANKPVSNFLLALFHDRVLSLRKTGRWLLPVACVLILIAAATAGVMYAFAPVRQEQRSTPDYTSAFFNLFSGEEANPAAGMVGKSPKILLAYNHRGSLYIRRVRMFILTSDLSALRKEEDSTVLYSRDYWQHSMKLNPEDEKAIIAAGYVAACVDSAKAESGQVSAIGIIRKFDEPQMHLGKIHSVEFKAAEASVVAALSKQHLCDYRL